MTRKIIAQFNWLIYQTYWQLEDQIEEYNDFLDLVFPITLYKKMFSYCFPDEKLNDDDIKRFQKTGGKIEFFCKNITLDENVDWIQIAERKNSILHQCDIDEFYIKAGLLFTYGYKEWIKDFTSEELRMLYIVIFEDNARNIDVTMLHEYLKKRKMGDAIREMDNLIKKMEKSINCQNQQRHKRRTEKIGSIITGLYNRIGSASLTNDLGPKGEQPNE